MSLLMKTNSSFCEIDAFVNEIPREALAASVEMVLKDHENGYHFPFRINESYKSGTRMEIEWSLLAIKFVESEIIQL